MLAHERHLCGYFLLQSIATLFFFFGYFQSPQQVRRATLSRNPVFDKPDWFVPEFSRVVVLADSNHLIGTFSEENTLKRR
jgi:hypothetical protein